MDKWLESTGFWVVAGLLAIAAIFAINFVMGRVTERQTADPEHHPHRVASELPRELHEPGRDEVLDLEDPTTPKR